MLEKKILRETLVCEKCNKEFWDSYNLLCISTFKQCLLCANKNDISGELNGKP